MHRQDAQCVNEFHEAVVAEPKISIYLETGRVLSCFVFTNILRFFRIIFPTSAMEASCLLIATHPYIRQQNWFLERFFSFVLFCSLCLLQKKICQMFFDKKGFCGF